MQEGQARHQRLRGVPDRAERLARPSGAVDETVWVADGTVWGGWWHRLGRLVGPSGAADGTVALLTHEAGERLCHGGGSQTGQRGCGRDDGSNQPFLLGLCSTDQSVVRGH